MIGDDEGKKNPAEPTQMRNLVVVQFYTENPPVVSIAAIACGE